VGTEGPEALTLSPAAALLWLDSGVSGFVLPEVCPKGWARSCGRSLLEKP